MKRHVKRAEPLAVTLKIGMTPSIRSPFCVIANDRPRGLLKKQEEAHLGLPTPISVFAANLSRPNQQPAPSFLSCCDYDPGPDADRLSYRVEIVGTTRLRPTSRSRAIVLMRAC